MNSKIDRKINLTSFEDVRSTTKIQNQLPWPDAASFWTKIEKVPQREDNGVLNNTTGYRTEDDPDADWNTKANGVPYVTKGRPNILFVDCLMLDFDNEPSRDDDEDKSEYDASRQRLSYKAALELFKDYEFAAYPSWSHKQVTYKWNGNGWKKHDLGNVSERGLDRFRIIIPFDKLCPIETYERLEQSFIEITKGYAASESFRATQIFWSPMWKEGIDVVDKCVWNRGKPIVWSDLKLSEEKPKYEKQPIVRSDVTGGTGKIILETCDIEKFLSDQGLNPKSGNNTWKRCDCPLGHQHSDNDKTAFYMKSHDEWGFNCMHTSHSNSGRFKTNEFIEYFGGREAFRPYCETIEKKENSIADIIKQLRKQSSDEIQPDEEPIEPIVPELERGDGVTLEEGQYNKKWCAEIELLPGNTYVKSYKGSGKTTQLEEYVKKCKKENLSVLLMGHRVSLLSAMAGRLGLADYKKITDWNNCPEHLAICVNSLNKIPPQMKYDVVLLDESEQVIQHMVADNGTINPTHRRVVFPQFFNFVRESEYFVALDADLSNGMTIQIIQRMFPPPPKRFVHAQVNVWVCPEQEIVVYQSKTNLKDAAIAAILEGGKNVLFISNSKIQIVALSEYLERHGVKHTCITSDNSGTPEIQEYIQRIQDDETITNQIILASPTLGTGIDIQAPFDHVFGFFEQGVNTIFDIDQQLYRVRNTDNISVWVNSQVLNKEESWQGIRNKINKRRKRIEQFVEYIPSDENEEWFQCLIDAHSIASAHKNINSNRLKEDYIIYKEQLGCKIKHVVKVDNNFLNEKKLSREMIKVYIRNILAADYASAFEFDEAKRLGKFDENKRWGLLKFRIRQFFGEDPDEKMIEMFLTGIEEQYWKFRTYERPDETLKNMDRKNAISSHPIDYTDVYFWKKLINEGLEALNFSRNGKWDIESIIHKGHPQIEVFGGWVEQNEQLIRDTLNIKLYGKQFELPAAGATDTEKKMHRPTRHIETFLKCIGLKLKQKGKLPRGSGNTRLTIYSIDSDLIDTFHEIRMNCKEQEDSAVWELQHLISRKK